MTFADCFNTYHLQFWTSRLYNTLYLHCSSQIIWICEKKYMSLKRTLFSIQSTIFWIFNIVVADVILVASSRLKNWNSPLSCVRKSSHALIKVSSIPPVSLFCMIFCLFRSTQASNKCYNLWGQSRWWKIDIGGDIQGKRLLKVGHSLNAFQSEISDPSWSRLKSSTPSDSASSSLLVLASPSSWPPSINLSTSASTSVFFGWPSFFGQSLSLVPLY